MLRLINNNVVEKKMPLNNVHSFPSRIIHAISSLSPTLTQVLASPTPHPHTQGHSCIGKMAEWIKAMTVPASPAARPMVEGVI